MGAIIRRESLADEKGILRTTAEKPAPIASKVLHRGDKLTPREARLLAAQTSDKPKVRKQPKKSAGT